MTDDDYERIGERVHIDMLIAYVARALNPHLTFRGGSRAAEWVRTDPTWYGLARRSRRVWPVQVATRQGEARFVRVIPLAYFTRERRG